MNIFYTIIQTLTDLSVSTMQGKPIKLRKKQQNKLIYLTPTISKT